VAQTRQVNITKAGKEAVLTKDSFEKTSIRVPPNSYLVAVFLFTFFSSLLIYLERDLLAGVSLIAGWIALPILAWSDRIVFDGQKLWRNGAVPRLWFWLNGKPRKLKINQIEQVETKAIRTEKRNGNFFYRYRTSLRGNNLYFAFASGGETYRQMTRKLFSLLPTDTLDNRSIELRDYLAAPKETLIKAKSSGIPSIEVLENSFKKFDQARNILHAERAKNEKSEGYAGEADGLRKLANELRVSGNLLQSLEVFRRALIIKPADGWLIFEFALCLHSYARAEGDEKLLRRAFAALRLAETRAGQDGELLARLGETYFQYNDWKRARIVFQKALTFAKNNFRSVRGLAEIALREGKIAHVIHHFESAIGSAETKALQNWVRRETEYFSRLNADEDYMESEVQRLNLLESIERGKKTSLWIALSGIVLVLVGLVSNPTIANIGWACASVALLIWAGLIISRNLLAERSPLMEAEE